MKLEEAIKTSKFRNARHKASLNILFTSYWMKSQVSGSMKEIGMTMEQFNVMRILKGRHPQPMCVRDIASRMIEKNSNVPRILDRLAAKKMVQRTVSETDRRETLICLTETGIARLEKANLIMDAVSDRMMNLTDEDAAVLNDILDRMRDNGESETETKK